jgi:phosphoribosylaminoimidazolecarboxamide formyltransferase / IMP cyclohydrolase
MSTGGTYSVLREEGIEVLRVEDVTGFPEMLDGRVKTLHPFVHGGILADREKTEHMEKIRQMGIPRIDMVVVNLYPFKDTVSKEGVTIKDAIENIDIGGPSMIRSAAKNHSSVAVLVDPKDYHTVFEELRQNERVLDSKILFSLSLKAFAHTAEYDSNIFNHFIGKNEELGTGLVNIKEYLDISNTKNEFNKNRFRDDRGDYLDEINISLVKKQGLRYGENPHQKASCYIYSERYNKTFADAYQIQGKELSYNNYLDGNSAFNIIKEFKEPCVAIIKHNNPCGAAISSNVKDAYELANSADPLSAFGGVIAANSTWTAEATRAMMDKYVEVLIAPEFEEEALLMLRQKENLRVLRVDLDLEKHLTNSDIDIKSIGGGILIQDADGNRCEWEDLLFAWQIVKNVKSNAITIIKNKMTVGIGAGQMSRVDAVKVAIEKSLSRCHGASMASDAFFPFEDAVEIAANNNIKAIIQPGGSVRDKEIIDACNNFNIAMVFTGKRHFKH